MKDVKTDLNLQMGILRNYMLGNSSQLKPLEKFQKKLVFHYTDSIPYRQLTIKKNLESGLMRFLTIFLLTRLLILKLSIGRKLVGEGLC